MQITQDPNHGKYYIRSYQPGEILINDEKIHSSVILTPDQLIAPWAPQNFAELSPEYLHIIIELKPEIFLLGTGIKQQFPPSRLLAEFYQKQIGIEIMDSPAACRTYNVLISEGRNVIAGILIR